MAAGERESESASTAGGSRSGRRRPAPPQGGRPLPARPRPVRRRHQTAGLQDVAFVRSPLAHARIRAIHIPEPLSRRRLHGRRSDRCEADPRGVRRCPASRSPSSRCSRPARCAMSANWWRCAWRQTRAEAEDIAAAVTLDLEPLPAVHDMLEAREPGSRAGPRALGRQRLSRKRLRGRYHQGARCADQGQPRNLDRAPMHVAARRPRRRRHLRSPARSAHALYRRADAAHRAQRAVRMLGIEQGRIRIVSPDIGGGFGHKGILLPEEVCLAWLALLQRPRPSAGSRTGASI